METQRVRPEHDGGIAVIVIDNPPIHAGSAAVREGLVAAIADVKSEDSLRGAVPIGAGNTFIAGSCCCPEGASRPQVDPAVAEWIAKARSDKGAAPLGIHPRQSTAAVRSECLKC